MNINGNSLPLPFFLVQSTLPGSLLFLVFFSPQCNHPDLSSSSFLLPTVSIILCPFGQPIYPLVLLLYQHGCLHISPTRNMLSKSTGFSMLLGFVLFFLVCFGLVLVLFFSGKGCLFVFFFYMCLDKFSPTSHSHDPKFDQCP